MPDLRESTRQLKLALERSERVATIHYSCESFFEVTDRPVAVSAIGVAEVIDMHGDAASQVFSIANSAPDDDPVSREKDMLTRFFDYVKTHPDTRWVHWNMNNATYGFAGLIARYRYLFGEEPPAVFGTAQLFDLDSLIEARYGREFAHHPKMRSLYSLNGFFMPFFADGATEAKAYADGDYGRCERSASTKATLLAATLGAFFTGTLQTANSVGALEFAGERLDAVKVVLELGQRFLYVEREISHRHGSRPTIQVDDEYDAQDLFRSLLAVFFDDVRPEDVTPAIAGGTARVDFVIPDFEMAIELKYARGSMSARSLGDELIIDRGRYETRKDVRHLVCLVFDHEGILRGPRGLETDLTRQASLDDFAVSVRIFDR